MMTPSEATMTTEPEKIIGLSDERYALTPTELRTMAAATEKIKGLELGGVHILPLNIEGLRYLVTFGEDEAGRFGVLAAWTAGGPPDVISQ